MVAVLDNLSRTWCTAFHPRPMWPIHGHYFCQRCNRQFAVPWA